MKGSLCLVYFSSVSIIIIEYLIIIKVKILTWSQSSGIFCPLPIGSVVVLDGWNCDRESPVTSGPGVGTKEGRDWHPIISFEGTFLSGLN